MKRNPWYGDKEGHRIAALMRWGGIRKGKVKRYRKVGGSMAKRKVRRSVSIGPGKRRRLDMRTKAYRLERLKQQRDAQSYMGMTLGPLKSRKRKFKYVSGKGWARIRNPFGGYTMARRRKRNTWYGQPRRHRKAAKKGWRRGHMLMGAKRRRRVRHANPMTSANPKRSYGFRRRRRNPAIMAQFGRFTGGVMNVRGWAPLAITGGLSAVTGAVVPGMLGVVNPWAKYGVQTAVAIGGGLAVESFVDKRHGEAWMVVGVAMVGYQLLKEFVLQPYFPQFAVGLGEYQSYYPNSEYIAQNEVSQQVGAFPSSLSAFPQTMGGYPGSDEMGAYPYDGAGY